MPKMKTLALTFALPTLLGKPGVVRTDWIAEGAQRAANDLSDEYAALVAQDRANDLSDEYALEMFMLEIRRADVKAFAKMKKISFTKAATKLGLLEAA